MPRQPSRRAAAKAIKRSITVRPELRALRPREISSILTGIRADRHVNQEEYPYWRAGLQMLSKGERKWHRKGVDYGYSPVKILGVETARRIHVETKRRAKKRK